MSGCRRTLTSVKTLEEVTYEAGRDALADQEALVVEPFGSRSGAPFGSR
jgi:hypothetical protein